MQPSRGGPFRHTLAALVAALAAVAVLGFGAGAAEARAPFTQGDIAPAAQVARQALVDLRQRPAPDTSRSYARARDSLAGKVAAASGGDVATLAREWDATTDQRLLVVYAALAQVGAKYRYASSDPSVGFDCSGLTSYAWSTVGVGLAHSSRAQIRAAAPVPATGARPGDLVYYPGHVSLAVGDGMVVHAPHRGAPVEVRAMWSKGGIRVGAPVP